MARSCVKDYPRLLFIVTTKDRFTNVPLFVRTWVVLSPGMRVKNHGTARVTDRDSPPRAAFTRALPTQISAVPSKRREEGSRRGCKTTHGSEWILSSNPTP